MVRSKEISETRGGTTCVPAIPDPGVVTVEKDDEAVSTRQQCTEPSLAALTTELLPSTIATSFTRTPERAEGTLPQCPVYVSLLLRLPAPSSICPVSQMRQVL